MGPVRSNPSGGPDVLSLFVLAALGLFGYKLLQGNLNRFVSPTTASGRSGALLYDTTTGSLIGAADNEVVYDKYGNAFKVLPGGSEMVDVSSGIRYSTAILQTKFDNEG